MIRMTEHPGILVKYLRYPGEFFYEKEKRSFYEKK
jgi:hypothetical protein